MESYIVQLDFSAAFDRVSHSGLVFNLKSIGLGVSVLSNCREFLSNRRQRVVVDCATSEWIPIISGMPQRSVLGPLLFILYTSEMFELVVKSSAGLTDCIPMLITPHYWQLFAASRPTVAALTVQTYCCCLVRSQHTYRDLTRIQ